MRASSFALHRTLLVSILTLQLLLCAPLLAQPSSISGSWYDPDRSGEGFVIQVIGEHEALLQENAPLLVSLARLDPEQLTIAADLPTPSKAAALAHGEHRAPAELLRATLACLPVRSTYRPSPATRSPVG